MAYTKNATVDSWDTAKQLEYYKANPAEAQQEIARANSVGGAAANNWASQLQSGMTPPTPQQASQGSSYNSAPVYAPPASTPSYSGSSNIIGNVSNSTDINKSYQSIYDSVRANNPGVNQINTLSDSKGNVYNTTSMTPQQTYALMLNKNGNQNASAVLSGMGLDINGNPVYAPPASSYTKNAQVDAMPVDQQLAYYAAHPQEAQQEIARAQGIGGSAAQNWVSQLSSMVPQNTGQSQGKSQQGSTNGAVQMSGGQWAPGNNVYGLSNDQYSALQNQANASSAADIAAQTTIAGQQKSGYQTSFDRAQQITKDNRTLENVANQRNLNPFSGRSDYAQGMIAREREITDRQGQQDLQSKLGNVDAQLADYAKSSTAKKQEIVTQLAKDLSSYQMQVEQLKLQQGDLALKSQNQQFNQQQDVKKQHIDLANFLTQQYGVTVHPTDDPMLSYAQVAGIPTTTAQKIALDAQNSNFDNAVKKALAENTINKTQADILQGAQQLAISQQNANTSSASQANSADRLTWEKEQAANKPKTIDYKSNPDFAESVSWISSNPNTAADELAKNTSALIAKYGYDGYAELKKLADGK